MQITTRLDFLLIYMLLSKHNKCMKYNQLIRLLFLFTLIGVPVWQNFIQRPATAWGNSSSSSSRVCYVRLNINSNCERDFQSCHTGSGFPCLVMQSHILALSMLYISVQEAVWAILKVGVPYEWIIFPFSVQSHLLPVSLASYRSTYI